jgi:hypothetical protein
MDPAGEVIVAASNEGIAQTWDLKNMVPIGAPLKSMRRTTASPASRCIAGSQFVAAGTNSGTVYVGQYTTNELATARSPIPARC